MAIAVVDELEIIDINKKDGGSLVWMPFHLIDDTLQTSQKQGPIWQASQGIVGGVKQQFVLSTFPFADIAGVIDNPADILVLNQVSNNTLEIEPCSVRMP